MISLEKPSRNGPHLAWRAKPPGFSRVAAGALDLRRGPQGPALVASGKASPHASSSGASRDSSPVDARAYLIILCKATKSSIKIRAQNFPFKKLWIYLILISAFLFFNTYLTTLTNTYIENTVLIYPLKFGSNLILSAIMATVIFKERTNIRSIIGMILITASIIFINVL